MSNTEPADRTNASTEHLNDEASLIAEIEKDLEDSNIIRPMLPPIKPFQHAPNVLPKLSMQALRRDAKKSSKFNLKASIEKLAAFTEENEILNTPDTQTDEEERNLEISLSELKKQLDIIKDQMSKCDNKKGLRYGSLSQEYQRIQTQILGAHKQLLAVNERRTANGRKRLALVDVKEVQSEGSSAASSPASAKVKSQPSPTTSSPSSSKTPKSSKEPGSPSQSQVKKSSMRKSSISIEKDQQANVNTTQETMLPQAPEQSTNNNGSPANKNKLPDIQQPQLRLNSQSEALAELERHKRKLVNTQDKMKDIFEYVIFIDNQFTERTKYWQDQKISRYDSLFNEFAKKCGERIQELRSHIVLYERQLYETNDELIRRGGDPRIREVLLNRRSVIQHLMLEVKSSVAEQQKKFEEARMFYLLRKKKYEEEWKFLKQNSSEEVHPTPTALRPSVPIEKVFDEAIAASLAKNATIQQQLQHAVAPGTKPDTQ